MGQTLSSDPNRRRLMSSQCRADPNKVPDTIQNIDKCLTEPEVQSIQNTSELATDFVSKIQKYKAIIDDINVTGEQIFGQAASSSQLKSVEERNRSLEKERDELREKIKNYKGIAETNARDFQDIKEQTSEVYPTKVLNVLEDYSLAVLLASLGFFCIVFFFFYVRMTGFGFQNILFGIFLVLIIFGVTLSFLFFML